MNILKARSLNKQYSGTTERAVQDFSICVEKGELVALLGESGCGKTTVLRMIAGLEMPDSGILEIGGKRVFDPQTFVEVENRKVGIVFQEHALFPHKTVAGNILFGLHKLKRSHAMKRMEEVIRLAGITGLEKRYPHQLSGGQQQRVALARALAPEPELILFDEPFSNIDSLLKSKLREQISTILRKTQTTAIFVTHDTTDALAIADRVLVMKNGLTIQAGTPVEIYKKPLTPYVANFFGKVNLLPFEAGHPILQTLLTAHKHQIAENSLVCIRPDAVIVSSEPSDESHAAEILSEQFLVGYKELKCRLPGPNAELELTVFAGTEQQFSSNRCYLRFSTGAIHLMFR